MIFRHFYKNWQIFNKNTYSTIGTYHIFAYQKCGLCFKKIPPEEGNPCQGGQRMVCYKKAEHQEGKVEANMNKYSGEAIRKKPLEETPAYAGYFQGTMFEAVERMAKRYPTYAALRFFGRVTDYRTMQAGIENCAKALRSIGIGEGDHVLIALPNCPQAIYTLYGVNLIGAIADLIHPLSAEAEIEFYLNESEAITAVTLDSFYPKFAAVKDKTKLRHLIIASIRDELPPLKALGYALTEGRKTEKIPASAPVLRWKQFLRGGNDFRGSVRAMRTRDDPAVVLYTGGTTGTTKGAVLTNNNINAAAKRVLATNEMAETGDKILAVMPIFHAFGLCVGIHTSLSGGGCSILIPRFSAASYARELLKNRCNFTAGVPTLYEALLRQKCLEKADLSFLKGVYSGGDNLSIELKKKMDEFLFAHSSPVPVREGYGTTETVGPCCLTPPQTYREGSIGLPFPDTYFKIVSPGTEQELPFGKEGEILISGPSVMKEYLNRPEETAQALRTHGDGKTWFYTGDLGTIDRDGFVYFRGRAKRVIVTSGYNVYPGQIENILDSCEVVRLSCVIGVPDEIKVQRVKAFVQLKSGISANDKVRQEILAECAKKIAKYAMPTEIEFRTELPTTLVGKVAYRKLEEEEQKKQ